MGLSDRVQSAHPSFLKAVKNCRGVKHAIGNNGLEIMDTTMAVLSPETCARQQQLFTVLIKVVLVKHPILTHAVDMHLDCTIFSSEKSSNCILSERTVRVRSYYPTSVFNFTDSLEAEWE